ncbi:hypothetical protein BC826DRAFT_1112945 [Russula brevipes]|nr:hypothetical protein BC826DRAFT_1112945 [Russula brevipes]
MFARQAGSKLAEEFIIKYDEGVEGINGLPPEDADVPTFDLNPSMVPSRAASLPCSPSEGAEGATLGKVLNFGPATPLDGPVIPSPSIPTYPSSLPDTPEASHLVSTSPTSSVSPQTPPDVHGSGFGPNVVSAKLSPLGVPVIRSFLTATAPATDRDPSTI